jgi:hypothetical protein
MMDVHEMSLAIADLQKRVEALESTVQPPLEFPEIDLGMIPGEGPKHPFEPFEYTERN